MDVLVYSKDPELIRLIEHIICKGRNCTFFLSAGSPDEYRKLASLIIFDLIILDGEIPCSGTRLDPKQVAERSRTDLLYIGDAEELDAVAELLGDSECSYLFRKHVDQVIRKALRRIARGKRYRDPLPETMAPGHAVVSLAT